MQPKWYTFLYRLSPYLKYKEAYNATKMVHISLSTKSIFEIQRGLQCKQNGTHFFID